ncbi:MAG: hypothetical protein ACTS4Z_00600 [Candidatus Hodgkinia cicadicola]
MFGRTAEATAVSIKRKPAGRLRTFKVILRDASFGQNFRRDCCAVAFTSRRR